MATATAASTTHAKPTAIVEIERLGFAWRQEPSYDLDRVSVERRVQVREITHYAPKDAVQRYAVQMGEVAFPPIVMTADDWIIDGNTRVGAKLQRKEKFTPAIVIEVGWENATAKQRAELAALAATLNQTNGVPLTSKESRDVARKLVELGWKTEQIGRAIGVKGSSVQAVKRELTAEDKLKRVGLDANGDVRGASLRALGAEKVVGLNDVPFKELASLAMDAGFNASEITQTAKELREISSDSGAIEHVQQLRTEMGDRIRERELTGVGKPPLSRQLRQRLGFITKYVGREHELLETDPNVGAIHIEALERSVEVLTNALQLQRGRS